jgi:hypothetical protein
MKEREYLKREKVADLEGFLNQQNINMVCDRTHRQTRAWCQQEGVDPDLVVGFLIRSGGFCDCHVPDLLIDLYCLEMPGWSLPTSWCIPDRALAAVECAREDMAQAMKLN